MRALAAFIPFVLLATAGTAAQPKHGRSLNFVCTFDKQPTAEKTVLDIEVDEAAHKGSVTVRNNGNQTAVDAAFTPTMLKMRFVFSDQLTVEYNIDRVTLGFEQRMLHARGTMSLPGTCELADAANRKF